MKSQKVIIRQYGYIAITVKCTLLHSNLIVLLHATFLNIVTALFKVLKSEKLFYLLYVLYTLI